MKLLNILIVSLTIHICLSSLAGGGFSVGGGGANVELEFFAVAEILAQVIEDDTSSFPIQGEELSKLLKYLKSKQGDVFMVQAQDQIFMKYNQDLLGLEIRKEEYEQDRYLPNSRVKEVAAINFRTKALIKVSRRLWKGVSSLSSTQLVFHEILGLMGRDYDLSISRNFSNWLGVKLVPTAPSKVVEKFTIKNNVLTMNTRLDMISTDLFGSTVHLPFVQLAQMYNNKKMDNELLPLFTRYSLNVVWSKNDQLAIVSFVGINGEQTTFKDVKVVHSAKDDTLSFTTTEEFKNRLEFKSKSLSKRIGPYSDIHRSIGSFLVNWNFSVSLSKGLIRVAPQVCKPHFQTCANLKMPPLDGSEDSSFYYLDYSAY